MENGTLPLLNLAGLAALLAAHVLNTCLAQSSNEDPTPYAPGRYYPLRFPDAPPLPFRPPGWPLIKLGEGIYVYDNRGVNPLADLLEAVAPVEGGQMLLSGFSETGLRLTAPSHTTTNSTTNFWLTIAGGEPDRTYELYSTTNLAQASSNMVWQFETTGTNGQTLCLTNLPGSRAFYRLSGRWRMGYWSFNDTNWLGGPWASAAHELQRAACPGLGHGQLESGQHERGAAAV
jgi:hypothetical protein